MRLRSAGSAAMKGLVVIPFVDCWKETHQAVLDASAQLEGQADVLLIDNGSGNIAREGAEMFAQSHGQVRLWQHRPPMPSLAATWNRALDYAWEIGHEDCFVWNNDIRVAAHMYDSLRAVAKVFGLWFTTPVNCAEGPDREAWRQAYIVEPLQALRDTLSLGGPDFSCFLITRECHEKYRFDERFQPAYHEDGDFHRRMWLGGDGDRIAGVTLPYLHYGSRTIHRSEAAYAAFQPQFAACRQRYVQKWGGEPHHERKLNPDSAEDYDGVGTPGGYLDMERPLPNVIVRGEVDGRD